MRGSTISRLLPAVATALMALAIPAAAAASPPSSLLPPQLRQSAARSEERPTSRPAVQPEFSLKTRDGYEFEVVGLGSVGTAFVGVTRNGGKSITGYAARGTVSGERLQADFGKFGKVAMRFRPSANWTGVKSHRICRGRGRYVSRTGTFVGEFRFRGEDGYVSVAVKRAKGRVISVAAKCRREQRNGRDRLSFELSQSGTWGLEVPFVEARWRTGVSATEFIAIGADHAAFYGGTEEAWGDLAVFHSAFLEKAPAKDVRVGNALTFARVSPPPPFSGTATFRAAPDGTRTWTGSLTVNFPGAEHYPLVGPQFKAAIGFKPELFLFF